MDGAETLGHERKTAASDEVTAFELPGLIDAFGLPDTMSAEPERGSR